MSRRLPTLKPRQVIRALERAGFILNRATGGHRYLIHPARPDLLVCVPVHPGAEARTYCRHTPGKACDTLMRLANYDPRSRVAWVDMPFFLIVTLLPPVAAWSLLFAGFWIAAGFRSG